MNSPKHTLHGTNDGVRITVWNYHGNSWPLGIVISSIFGIVEQMAEFVLEGRERPSCLVEGSTNQRRWGRPVLYSPSNIICSPFVASKSIVILIHLIIGWG